MNSQYLQESARTIAAICAVTALMECASDGCMFSGGLRLVYGAVAASSVLHLLIIGIQRVF